MHFTVPPREVWAALLALVLGAAIFDIRYRRIPNWLTVSGVLIGLALNTFLDPVWPGLRFSLKGLGLGFAVYFLLYALRAMGAGDVKLMAAVGALAGWEDWVGILLVTSIIGGVAGLILVATRGRMKSTLWNVAFILSEMKSGRPAYVGNEELDVKHPKALGMPHGLIIALGTVLFLALAARFAR
ncbi:MAG: A24 family peptidase [Acidobacteriia bacterium]|nr:A24 family peptidase [Terriglobia bacterium]